MSSLAELSLEITYRSYGASIVRDFYDPCLERAILYRRAVGYFTSSGLATAAKGLAQFISHGGRMKLVASPKLEQKDMEAIEKGYKSRLQVIESVVSKELKEIEDVLTKDRISALAWMISTGALEIKLALPVDETGAIKHGLYHEKIGIFTDLQKNAVAFTGSPNETQGGLIDNFESIDVFWSWEDPQNRTEEKIRYFNTLWNKETPGLAVFSFPEACKEELLKYKKATPPEFETFKSSFQDSFNYEGLDLWQHQESAIKSWEENNRKGLLCMATGSGKTITSVRAATKCEGIKFLVVGVPRLALVDQWENVLLQNTSCQEIIRVCESSQNWQEPLFSRLLTISQRSEPLVIVGTLSSLSGEKFLRIISELNIPRESLLVVDEVHNAGSPKNQKSLSEKFTWRLGLSATPARHYDEEGSQFIEEYFDGIVYNYGLKQALADGHLCPYKYYLYFAEMTECEYQEFTDLTQRIIQIRGMNQNSITYATDNNIDSDSPDVTPLLVKRARILKKSLTKEAIFKEILQEHHLQKGLVYCTDHDQLEEMGGIMNRNNVMHLQYTSHTTPTARKKALELLKKSEISALLAIDCLDEGVDVPDVDMAIILASSSNKRQFIQRRGRILRKSEGKDFAKLIDVITVPPASQGSEAKDMLSGELTRAKEMADLAENRYQAIHSLAQQTKKYGVMITELLSGEDDG